MSTTPRQRLVSLIQRHVANPVMRAVPIQTLLETTGRKSGEPRRTPIGGKLDGRIFWLVSEFGDRSQYVRNIQADPRGTGPRSRSLAQWHRRATAR